METINKICYAEQAFIELDEETMQQTEQEAINKGIIVVDEFGDYTEEFKLWYYKQVNG